MNGGQLLQSALLDPLSYIGSHYPDVRKCRSGINNPRPIGLPGLKWSYTQNLMKYAVLKNYEQMGPFSDQMRPWLFMMLHCSTVLFCISIVINIYMQLIYAKKNNLFFSACRRRQFSIFQTRYLGPHSKFYGKTAKLIVMPFVRFSLGFWKNLTI